MRTSLSGTNILQLGNQRTTTRIGQKIAKRRRWPAEHQQAIFLAFGETVSAGEFIDAPSRLSTSGPDIIYWISRLKKCASHLVCVIEKNVHSRLRHRTETSLRPDLSIDHSMIYILVKME
ncbi:hypothetical protein CO670_05185 [Rhizobium sp. J15]|nr:hypothetical protein CO670_05185 [Rhizobium sp. J15]